MNKPLDMQTAKIGDLTVVTVVVDGVPYVAGNEHPNFNEILQAAIAGDKKVVELFDTAATIQKKFDLVSDRVSIRNGQVFLDGEPVHSALTDQIIEFQKAGEDFSYLVNFYEKIEQNPNPDSREMLYTWLATHKFTITPDGNLVGYKGVKKIAEGQYESINHGHAIVNGQEYNGAIPNNIGDIVTMPRGEVEHDPSSGCSRGLHVGTWDYAKDFSRGEVLEVIVNPRDVVSVPYDCAAKKLRTCRYVVAGVVESEYTKPLVDNSNWGASAYDDYEDEWTDNDYEDDWM